MAKICSAAKSRVLKLGGNPYRFELCKKELGSHTPRLIFQWGSFKPPPLGLNRDSESLA